MLAALSFREPDRIPVDFWADGEVAERLRGHVGAADREALLQALGVDLRYIPGPAQAGQTYRTLEGGRILDHWGVVRRPMSVDGVDRAGRAWTWNYLHLERGPLEGAAAAREVDAYQGWPSAGMWDYSGVEAQTRTIRDAGCAVVFGGDRLDRTAQLKAGMYLRGMEQFLIDLVTEEEIVDAVLEHVVGYYLDYNRRVFEAAKGKIDIFFMGDDMGMQTGPMVSPETYRRFFKGNLRRFNDLAHAYGAKTMYHTCGNVVELIPDFIETGLDILQAVQPACMDLKALKREFGRSLSFQGGMDIQHTLPHGSPEDVRREVRERAETLGPGGGYIFCSSHNLLPDVPTENAIALFDAYREYGRYA